MNEREILLQQLLMLSRPLSELHSSLSKLTWEGDKLVTLRPQMVIGILQRYRSEEITSQDVEDWANAVEGREDIEYEQTHLDILRESIFILANPLLTTYLNKDEARRLIEKLQ